jgi:hypothetical protein
MPTGLFEHGAVTKSFSISGVPGPARRVFQAVFQPFTRV